MDLPNSGTIKSSSMLLDCILIVSNVPTETSDLDLADGTYIDMLGQSQPLEITDVEGHRAVSSPRYHGLSLAVGRGSTRAYRNDGFHKPSADACQLLPNSLKEVL